MHKTFTKSFRKLLITFLVLIVPIVAGGADSAPSATPSSSSSPAQAESSVPPASPAPANQQTQPKNNSAPVPGNPPLPAPSAPPAELKKSETPPASPLKLAPPTVRIGFVDLVRIGQESKQGKAAQSLVKAKGEKYRSRIAAKEKQLEKQKAAIQKKLATMSPEERAAKAKEFEKKVENFRKFVQKAENEMKPLQDKAARELFLEIQKAATAYGKANGFAAILPSKDLLYLGTGSLPEDVTDGVLKQMGEK